MTLTGEEAAVYCTAPVTDKSIFTLMMTFRKRQFTEALQVTTKNHQKKVSYITSTIPRIYMQIAEPEEFAAELG